MSQWRDQLIKGILEQKYVDSILDYKRLVN